MVFERTLTWALQVGGEQEVDVHMVGWGVLASLSRRKQ